MTKAINIGISACLLGEPVRYDGGHKKDEYLTGTLGLFCRFVPVCPEVESGMPVPREAMRLEGDPAAPVLLSRFSRTDRTGLLLAYCRRKLPELEQADLSGFVFKKNSPSCGLSRVKVYGADGMPVKYGSGIFAAAVARHLPLLPLEEEGRLGEPAIRENFIVRVFSYRRWQDFLENGFSYGRLIEFHATHKLLLMAHDLRTYRSLGALVANSREQEPKVLTARYLELFMKGLALPATVSKQTNVLQHIAGYFKKLLSPAEKAELLALIGQYHDRLVPLAEPLALLWHYAGKYDQVYLQKQVYFSPCPEELLLRNHVQP